MAPPLLADVYAGKITMVWFFLKACDQKISELMH